MAIISRGFGGRRREPAPNLPPGQYLTHDFPVLSAGPTPRIPLDRWHFTVATETGEKHTWDWAQFTALPAEDVTVDIHCVTKWSKLGTSWRGVSLDTLIEDVETAATPPTCRSRICSTARPGSRTSSTASRCTRSTAGRPGC